MKVGAVGEEIARELLEAAVPVLQDLERTCPFMPRIEPGKWSGMDRRFDAFAWGPDNDAQGIHVEADDSAAERVASLADQLQELVVENLVPLGHQAVWPECPEHPRSHPLTATVDDGDAVWICPKSQTVISAIGGL